jgi:molybdate transport system substrate-binding protein
VAAAADLARTAPQLGPAFAQATGYQARFIFGASGMLTRQIENGAPYDVFLCANDSFINELAQTGNLVPGSIVLYAQGRLALWSRSGRIRTLADLARPGVRHIAIANPLHAPYGVAAKEALTTQGLWDKVSARLVYGENVNQTLQYAESGNADATITAWSLVFDKGGILLPAAWHAPIRQLGAVVKTSRHPREASAFLQFLTGPAGRDILRRFGFEAAL